MKYEIEVADNAVKALRTIPKKERLSIQEKIDSLSDEPRPEGCLKLKGSSRSPLYRIRFGNYRIVYTIKGDILFVLVVDIGHRKGVYR